RPFSVLSTASNHFYEWCVRTAASSKVQLITDQSSLVNNVAVGVTILHAPGNGEFLRSTSTLTDRVVELRNADRASDAGILQLQVEIGFADSAVVCRSFYNPVSS